jgi:hypothetical protein
LRGGKINQQPAVVRKCGGASYEVAEDGISWARRRVKRRAAAAEPASPPPAPKRRRRHDPPEGLLKGSISARPSRKRKLEGASDTTDEDFLAETIRQVKRVKVASNTTRAAGLEALLPYLQAMKPACRQYVVRQAPPHPGQPLGDASGDGQSAGLAPDAYDLDARAAKTVLQNTGRIDCPVFIARGAPSSIFDWEIDPRRPVEQVLDWLPDLDENHYLDDKQAPRADIGASKQVTVAEMRERFLNQQQHQPYPWNFPEIPFPMPAPEMPGFLRHPSCNLLIDIIRYVRDINIEQICPATCKYHGTTAERCPTHFQTADEIVEFRRGVQHWLGTIMMAEAGAYTPEHYDSLGFGTFISCYEGEIGFAYQTTAPTPPRKARGKAKASKQWFYKIMRPGDAVYMPPGMKHLVFRQPYGNQMLATAVRVLRYCDIVEWLQILSTESDAEEEDPDYFCRVARGLVMGARHYIDQAKAQNKVEKFCGAQKVKEAEKVLAAIEKKLQKLLKAQK